MHKIQPYADVAIVKDRSLVLLTEVLDVAGEGDGVADLDPVGPGVAAEVRLGHRGGGGRGGIHWLASPVALPVVEELQIFALPCKSKQRTGTEMNRGAFTGMTSEKM